MKVYLQMNEEEMRNEITQFLAEQGVDSKVLELLNTAVFKQSYFNTLAAVLNEMIKNYGFTFNSVKAPITTLVVATK